jgi:uncharacterized membrane protein (UPF0127 family)
MRVRATTVLLLIALTGCGAKDDGGSGASVKVGDAEVHVELADTPAEQANGLSGRPPLDADEGMLFDFPRSSRQPFWMKDMRFPIDIVWIANGRVAQVSPRLPAPAPGTADADLPLYRPRQDIDSVLEVSSGWARKNGVGPGDRVEVAR